MELLKYTRLARRQRDVESAVRRRLALRVLRAESHEIRLLHSIRHSRESDCEKGDNGEGVFHGERLPGKDGSTKMQCGCAAG